MFDPPDNPKEQMDGVLDVLGFSPGDTSKRSKCANRIRDQIEFHQLHRENEPSKIFSEDRDDLETVGNGFRSILSTLRKQDSGFAGYFLDSPDQNIAMLEKWEKQTKDALLGIPPKKAGRPSEEADRHFIAALVDIFEEENPQKRNATSTPDSPFVVFVRLVYEYSTGQQRDLIDPIKEVLRLRKHRYPVGDSL